MRIMYVQHICWGGLYVHVKVMFGSYPAKPLRYKTLEALIIINTNCTTVFTFTQ